MVNVFSSLGHYFKQMPRNTAGRSSCAPVMTSEEHVHFSSCWHVVSEYAYSPKGCEWAYISLPFQTYINSTIIFQQFQQTKWNPSQALLNVDCMTKALFSFNSRFVCFSILYKFWPISIRGGHSKCPLVWKDFQHWLQLSCITKLWRNTTAMCIPCKVPHTERRGCLYW